MYNWFMFGVRHIENGNHSSSILADTKRDKKVKEQ